MTERNPVVPTPTWIDRAIESAIARGEFDDLAGAGKPLPPHTGDENWWVRDKLRREGVSFLPRGLQVRREIERQLDAVLALDSEESVRARIDVLNADIASANARVIDGPSVDLAPIDPDRVVERWRAARE